MYKNIIENLLLLDDNLIGTECIVPLIRYSSERVYRIKLHTIFYTFNVQNPPQKSGYFLVRFIKRNLVSVIREATSLEKVEYIKQFISFEVVAFESLGKYLKDIWKCVFNQQFILVGNIENVISFQRIQCFTDYSGLTWMIAVNESTNIPEQYQNALRNNPKVLNFITNDQEFLYNHILKEYVKIRTQSFEELMRYYVEMNDCELISYLELPNDRIRYHIRYRGHSLTSLVTDRQFRVIQAGFCVDGEDRQYTLATICIAWKFRCNQYEYEDD